MGCGASSGGVASQPGGGAEAIEDRSQQPRVPAPPSTLPPAYICLYCDDINCICRCLYCGEYGHNTKLCPRRLAHRDDAQIGVPGGAPVVVHPLASTAQTAFPYTRFDDEVEIDRSRSHAPVRYSRLIDEAPRHVAALMIQSTWRGMVVRARNHILSPHYTAKEAAQLSAYGSWERAGLFLVFVGEPPPPWLCRPAAREVSRGAQAACARSSSLCVSVSGTD